MLALDHMARPMVQAQGKNDTTHEPRLAPSSKGMKGFLFVLCGCEHDTLTADFLEVAVLRLVIFVSGKRLA